MKVIDGRGDYWTETDRQIVISEALDKKAARETNAEFCLVNAVPFGTPRRQLP
jgi:hypothetical protein